MGRRRLTDEERSKRKKIWSKKWRDANKDKAKEAIKKWALEHPEKMKEASKRYYDRNKELCFARRKRWMANNPEKSKKWYLENIERVKQVSKKYRSENREKLLNRPSNIKRYLNNPFATKEMIELKRAIISINRYLRTQLKVKQNEAA